MVQPGSVPHSLFAERGLSTFSDSYDPSWSPYGSVPELQNSGHTLGSQAIDPSLNMGLPRQWCRDFEEQGFCLRGDMCPMEHGLNRIVVEDVQVSYFISFHTPQNANFSDSVLDVNVIKFFNELDCGSIIR